MGPPRRHKKTNACENKQNRERNIYFDICVKGYKARKQLSKHLKKHTVEKMVDSETDNESINNYNAF